MALVKSRTLRPSLLAKIYISSKSSRKSGSPPVNLTVRQPREAASVRISFIFSVLSSLLLGRIVDRQVNVAVDTVVVTSLSNFQVQTYREGDGSGKGSRKFLLRSYSYYQLQREMSSNWSIILPVRSNLSL